MGEDKCCFKKNQLNFFRVCHLATNVVPCKLREVFVHQWNLQYSSQHGQWSNTSKNGQDFVSMESETNKRRNREMLNTMQNGDIELWDCTMLFYGLLFSSSIGRNLDSEIRRHVDSLREFRNQSFAHVNKGEVTSSDFQVILNRLLQALLGLRCDTSPVKQVQNLNSFTTDEVNQLQERLEDEKIAQSELDKRICKIEDRLWDLEKKTCPNESDEEGDYANIVEKPFNRDKSVRTFAILPDKPNHATIHRHQVNEVIKSLEDLRIMHDDKITSVFIVGEPLSGKTECARMIGQTLSKNTPIIATIQCGSFQQFALSLKQLSQKLGYNKGSFLSLDKASISSQIEMLSLFVKEKLYTLSSWLIILDDVLEETKELLDYLPQPGDQGTGQVIVTTQDRSLVMDNRCCLPVLLDSLTLMESIQLLSLLVGNIPQDLARFVSENLEFQPAFLVSAAKQVKLQSAKDNKSLVDTWKEMLEIVQNRYKEVWPYYHAALDEATRSKLKSTIEMVTKRSNVIEECFHLLLLAKGSHLPLNFLTRFISSDLNISETEVEHCLRDSPLIGVSTNDNVVMSGIIFKLSCDAFAPAVKAQRMIYRLRRLCKFCVSNAHDAVVAKVMKFMSPKLMQYLALLHLRFATYEEQRILYHELGKAYLCVLVDYSSAVRCFTKAISTFEESNDIAGPEYALLLYSMGNVLRLTGSTEEAWKYLTKSLKILKAISCDNVSEDVAGCLSSLGLVCLSQGELDRARELHYRALKMREELHGNDHIKTATSLNNIGGVYHEQGDLVAAKKYYWKALEIKGRNYGWDFPHMANSFNNIAEISHEQGDFCGAISIHKRALKIRQRLYGDEHPDVANSLNNIAVIYQKLEELSAARKYHTKALAIRKKVYGDEHLEVACSLNCLGEVYYDEGDLAAAESCHIQALRIRQHHSVTSWHPEVITSLHNLMLLYIADQKFSIATEYAYEICKVCQKMHGMGDARTVKAFRKLTELSKRESQGRHFDLNHEHVEKLSSL